MSFVKTMNAKLGMNLNTEKKLSSLKEACANKSEHYELNIISELIQDFNPEKDNVELINKLQQIIANIKQATSVKNKQAYFAYRLLLILAEIKPLNNVDPISLKPINELEKVVTSSQHQFNFSSLMQYLAEQTGAPINPLTNKEFHDLDILHFREISEAEEISSNTEGLQDHKDESLHKDLELTEEINSYTVVARDNKTFRKFLPHKIIDAIKKAYVAAGENSSSMHDIAYVHSINIIKELLVDFQQDKMIRLEKLQDYVEKELVNNSKFEIAKAYIIYRAQHNQGRGIESQQQSKTIIVKKSNGKLGKLTQASLDKLVLACIKDVKDVESNYIVSETMRNLYESISETEVKNALVMTARTLIEKEPNYSYVAAKLQHKLLCDEAMVIYNKKPKPIAEVYNDYHDLFEIYIKKAIEFELLSPKLEKFDLKYLQKHIDCKRDNILTYLSMQTLYDRYFLHKEEVRFELPQMFFMRVAMGLALREDNPNERAIEYYNLLSSLDYMSSTPTLFNSGSLRSQLSSCYISDIQDDLTGKGGIYGAISDNAALQKFAGGIANSWTHVRAHGSYIKGTNGKSSGIIPFMNVADATAIAVNQGGKRKGAVVGYLETWHMDIEDFLELRKNTGDERRRTHDMNTANWIPDLFMKRVNENKEWTLFSPNETPDLHNIYGPEFDKAYEKYEKLAEKGAVRGKKIQAVKLWRKMLTMLFETGHPWLTFKDACNIRSPQQHVGVIHSSNLCTEITLNTSQDEIAVCNLGSVNLAHHIDGNGGLDSEKLRKTVRTAIRMLDNVVDINYYAVPQAEHSNLKHRPIGLGKMGFQDALYLQGIPYDSDAAIEFADRCMEEISYYAIEASSDLAKERGEYATYKGSLWDQGILPIDSINHLKEYRKEYLKQDTSSKLDWDALREKIKKQGMRNSNTMAIAPTATIANICGVTQSIEPTYQNLFVKSNISGEFTIINPYLVKELKEQGLWDDMMVQDLKYHNGSVQKIERINDQVKSLYKTAFEINQEFLIQANSRRAKWIDQSSSLNLYIDKPSGKKLHDMYMQAWLLGLKTTYYLRSRGATGTEKSTIKDTSLNSVKAKPVVCNLSSDECESCQ